MPKPSTGTVRVLVHDGQKQWHAKWTRVDGTRTPWQPIDPGIALDDVAGARACAARWASRVRHVAPKPATAETCDTYFARLALARKAEGITNVRKEGYDWAKWISPRIGSRPVASVTRDEIEDVRNALDTEVKLRLTSGLAAGLSGKSAMNIWSCLRTTFKEAVSARDRTLRVRPDDPTAGHKPPLSTPSRAKTFLFPNEVTRLLECEAVPLEWRRAYAVAVWTYVRPEELEALTWADVDFDAGTVSVSKAIDARTGKAKPMPKTANAVREVPIEPTLRPLLVAMHAERASDRAPVLPVLRELNDKFRAKLLREHLELAGVKRERLRADTLTLMRVNFRSCRDTGVTWLALAGVSLAAAQRRAGHQDVSQTLAYVKLAEDLSGAIGEPFPALPAGLLESPRNSPGRFKPRKNPSISVPEEGVEPAHENITIDRENKDDRASGEAFESATLVVTGREPSHTVSVHGATTAPPSHGTSDGLPASSDDALKLAIKLAVDAGAWDRAVALIEVARDLVKPAPAVLELVAKRQR